jgi:hypothetical protein
MKKILLLLTLFALVACSKKNTPAPTPDVTIEYRFTTNTTATYNVSYLGTDNAKVNTTFTGTSFSKTITTNRSTGFRNAVFFIGLTSRDKVINGTADILVDSKVSNHVNLTFKTTDGNYSTDLTFYASVFK